MLAKTSSEVGGSSVTVSKDNLPVCADGRSKRLSNLGGPNSSRVLGPQGVTVADFPTGNELDAANGAVHEDAAIEINRKLVVDSLKASLSPVVPL